MAQSLDDLIAQYEREHDRGKMGIESAPTDADLGDLTRRVQDIAKDWTSDEIKRQKDVQNDIQKDDPTPTRQAVIDGLDKAGKAKATGQDGT